jgi:hypothetical protein
MRVFNPFKMQRSYKAKKSAVVEAEDTVVAAGGDGLMRGPLRTTSAQEGELDPIPVMEGGWRSAVDTVPAGRPAPSPLPVDGGAECTVYSLQ